MQNQIFKAFSERNWNEYYKQGKEHSLKIDLLKKQI